MSQLHERTRWASEKEPYISVDSVVLLKDENLPLLKWHMGRMSKLVYGNDGVTRVEEVHTAYRIVTRAIRKLCPLVIEDVKLRKICLLLYT